MEEETKGNDRRCSQRGNGGQSDNMGSYRAFQRFSTWQKVLEMIANVLVLLLAVSEMQSVVVSKE